MESKTREHSGHIIGDIKSRIQALSREEINFTLKVQDIWSQLPGEFKEEFNNLTYRMNPNPKEHMNRVYLFMNGVTRRWS